MERVSADIKVYDSFIEITPDKGVDDNFVYEIKIKHAKALNKSKVIENKVVSVVTRLTPSYCSLEAVRSIVDSYDVSDERTLYFIREASLFAEYVTKQPYDEYDVPFAVFQYVKHKAAYDSLLKFYVDLTSSSGMEGTLADITFKNPSSFPAMKDLLKELKQEVEKWTEHLRGNGFEGRVAPASAVRGARNTPGSPFGMSKVGRYVPGHSYGTTFNGSGYGRGVGGR